MHPIINVIFFPYRLQVALLNRASVYEAGHTLVHLAIRFHREDMLARLLSHFEAAESRLPGSASGRGVKYVPSYVAPDLASAIRRHVAQALRQRKGPFPCFYLAEWATYSLPPGELQPSSLYHYDHIRSAFRVWWKKM